MARVDLSAGCPGSSSLNDPARAGRHPGTFFRWLCPGGAQRIGPRSSGSPLPGRPCRLIWAECSSLRSPQGGEKSAEVTMAAVHSLPKAALRASAGVSVTSVAAPVGLGGARVGSSRPVGSAALVV